MTKLKRFILVAVVLGVMVTVASIGTGSAQYIGSYMYCYEVWVNGFHGAEMGCGPIFPGSGQCDYLNNSTGSSMNYCRGDECWFYTGNSYNGGVGTAGYARGCCYGYQCGHCNYSSCQQNC